MQHGAPVQQQSFADWEAKYDPRSRRWFYVNHVTKKTQWNDPRVQTNQGTVKNTVRPATKTVTPTQTSPTNVHQQALPTGWEAKFDPGSKRWFYVNHLTKKTQWEDPRIQFPVQAQFQANKRVQQQEYAQPATSTQKNKIDNVMKNHSADIALEQKQELQRKMSTDRQRSIVEAVVSPANKSATQPRNYQQQHQPNKNVASELKTSIKTVDQQKKNIDSKIQNQQKNYSTTQNQAKPLPVQNPMSKVKSINQSQTANKEKAMPVDLPEQQVDKIRQKSVQQKTIPQKTEEKKMSENEKLECLRKLKQRFPELDDVTINMCFTSSKHDFTMTENVLQLEREKLEKRKSILEAEVKYVKPVQKETKDLVPKVFEEKAALQPSSIKTNLPSLPVTKKINQSDLQPVTLENNQSDMQPVTLQDNQSELQPVTLENNQSNMEPVSLQNNQSELQPVIIENNQEKLKPVVFDDNSDLKPTILKEEAVKEQVSQTAKVISKSIASESQTKTVKSSIKENINVTDLHIQTKNKQFSTSISLTSKLRCQPKGPNPLNIKGPNPNLLIKEKIIPVGPNKSLLIGPQISNYVGALNSNYSGPSGINKGSSVKTAVPMLNRKVC